MQVVSLAPVPVASLAWRVGDGAWALGVVCKLTFQLTPGEAKLAKRHDPIYERDRFPDGDEQASLYAPSDLVPTRPLTDVTVVGSAYAPRGTPTSSLDVRLHIQSIDKSLRIEAAPTSRGKPFKSAPLGYEYAEPSSTNPVGNTIEDGKYPHATRIIPSVDPTATNPGHTSPGFGPIASHWVARKSHLISSAQADGEEPSFEEGRGPYTLPAGFDLKFFNAAPPDQQLPELLPNVEIALENLHPDHPELTTRLPNVAPQVFVERKGATRREEYDTRITGLWIDTRRAIATLTWHAQVHLDAADEPGRAWVAVAGPGARLSMAQLSRLIGTLSRSKDGTPIESPDDEETTDDTGQDLLGQTVSIKAKDRHRLQEALAKGPEVTQTSLLSSDHLLGDEDTARANPFDKRDGTPSKEEVARGNGKAEGNGRTDGRRDSRPPRPKSTPPRPGSSPPRPSAPPPRPGAPPKPRTPPKKRRAPESGHDKDHLADIIDPAERTASGIAAPPTDGSPSWLAKGGPQEQRSPSVPPPPPQRARAGTGTAPPPAGAPHSAPHSALVPPLPSRRGNAITSPGLGPGGAGAAASAWPTTHVVPNRDDQLADTSSLPGADERDRDETLAPHDLKAKRERNPDEVVELLWFDGDATRRLRKSWPKLCDELEFAPRDDRHDITSDDPAEARRHHLHFGVLTEARANQIGELRHALREAISQTGRFTPPLVVLKGTLRFPFDPIETLRATASTVKPVSGDDKKLEEALAQVDELLQTPLLSGNTETVANFTKHLRKLYQDSRRALSIEYLDETVERMLLEQRRYQKRTLFGGPCIRALLATRKEDKGIPAYLPEDLADRLPMMTTFEARVIAEGHVRQDQYEPHPHALRIVTLGRVIRFD